MAIKGLTKVSGKSFDDIVKVLKRERVLYEGHRIEGEFAHYIIDSRITIKEKDFWVVRTYAGEPTTRERENNFYYAGHKIEEGFDFKNLDGRGRFEHGILIERTCVHVTDDE